MSTPFDPQPLTAAQQQQVNDRASANALINQVLAGYAEAKVAFAKALAVSVELTHEAQIKPAFEVDVEGLIKQEKEYLRLQDLVRNFGYYFQAVQGWRVGVGQPNHPTFKQLQDGLAGSYLDVTLAIVTNQPKSV